MRTLICTAALAMALLASVGKAHAAGACLSDGTTSDADYTLVCFTDCALDAPEQLWHVSVADFDADVQTILALEQCAGWYYFDAAPIAATLKPRRGKALGHH